MFGNKGSHPLRRRKLLEIWLCLVTKPHPTSRQGAGYFIKAKVPPCKILLKSMPRNVSEEVKIFVILCKLRQVTVPLPLTWGTRYEQTIINSSWGIHTIYITRLSIELDKFKMSLFSLTKWPCPTVLGLGTSYQQIGKALVQDSSIWRAVLRSRKCSTSLQTAHDYGRNSMAIGDKNWVIYKWKTKVLYWSEENGGDEEELYGNPTML